MQAPKRKNTSEPRKMLLNGIIAYNGGLVCAIPANYGELLRCK